LAIEETLEDSFCAELVEPAHHGMAFGILATVNGIGDFLSSTVVGLLWSAVGQTAAFGYIVNQFLNSHWATFYLAIAGDSAWGLCREPPA